MTENMTTEHIPSVYIPLDRRQALIEGEDLPDHTRGAALFADISGFTPLTEALTRTLGPRRGAEELTHQLNQVYDALVATVNHYGGSVIGFAGDAITCWFGESKQSLETAPLRAASLHGASFHDASLRATMCALAMQREMEAFATVTLASGDTIALAMKASVATGPARRFLIGDPEIQYIDVLAGETLMRMAAGEHLAERGDVVIDAATLQRLPEAIQIREWRVAEDSGERFAVLEPTTTLLETENLRPLPLPSGMTKSAIRPWLLPAVYERLTEGLGEFLLELRPVVVLFLRFQGIDYDHDEAAGEKLDRYIRWVQQTITRYDGALLQLIIGDKGNFLYAAFGAPIAHEDDAQRAVSAAWELLSPPAEIDFIEPVQIGISQGTMRAGAYGGMTRRTYGVLGDEANLAARLMQNAKPGEALVSKHIYDAVTKGFVWEKLSAIQVKGKQRPVPVTRLVGKTQSRAPAVVYDTALVGREAELERLTDMLAPCFKGEFAGMTYVYGEPGVGKSRLIYELRQRLQQSHAFSWFTCPADPILRQALNPFKYFLRQYFGQSSTHAEETNKANFDALLSGLIASLKTPQTPKASHTLAAELERTRSMLGALVDLHWPGSLYEQLEPELRFRNMLTAFKTLIQAESLRQPVILHIEDAHWLDTDSHELIASLTRNVTPYPFAVLISGRYRDDGSPFSIEVDPSIAQHTMDLGVLSPEGIQLLTSQVLGREASMSLAYFLAARTEGNPLFVEQLALDLRERGLIKVRNDKWTVVLMDGAGTSVIETVPATINAVLIARLDRLAAQVKAVVQTAAVLGREFEVDILSNMLQNDVSLIQKVQRAEAEMIWSALAEMRYIFRHTMMRDAAYDMQLQARLRELHALAAQSIEKVYTTEIEIHYADLAYHYRKAEDTINEFRYAKLAGEHAASQFANHEAIDHYTQALACVASLPADEHDVQQQDIHAELGELLTTTGQYDEAEAHLEKALDLSRQRDDPEAQAHVCRWLAQLFELRGEYPQALAWLERGLHTLGERETPETAEMQLIAGLIYTRQGDYDNATKQFQDAQRLAEHFDEVATLARANNGLGVVRLRDNITMAIEHFQQAFSLYEQAGNIPGQATSHNLLANAYFDTGHWHQAYYHYRQARDVFDQIGDVYNRAFTDNNLGEIALYQGHLDEALTFYQGAVETMEQIGGSTYVLGVLHMNLGHVFIRRSEIETAREQLTTAQTYFEQGQVRDFLPELHRHFAEAALSIEQLEDAEAQGQIALDLARELEMHGEIGYILRVLGEISTAQGHPDAAEQHFEESISILEEMGDEYETARSQLARARFYATQGDASQMRNALGQCLPVFERLGAALDRDAARELQRTVF